MLDVAQRGTDLITRPCRKLVRESAERVARRWYDDETGVALTDRHRRIGGRSQLITRRVADPLQYALLRRLHRALVQRIDHTWIDVDADDPVTAARQTCRQRH